ncbi:MAG: hypothetical protein O9326_24405 [Microcystis sp. LE19-338.1B]|jgi:hypothetical protein|nr:hypothetical protein [Microcystis sp. LE19-338.1B]MCZ8357955.1 hypothetical protein [Microcystis sp. LE19-388.1G]
MLVLRKSDWDHQKPGIILLIVHKLVQEERATKPETPDDRLLTRRLLTPNPTNKLFQQTLIMQERLICGFHPSGWNQEENCPDWQTEDP